MHAARIDADEQKVPDLAGKIGTDEDGDQSPAWTEIG